MVCFIDSVEILSKDNEKLKALNDLEKSVFQSTWNINVPSNMTGWDTFVP